MIVAYQKAAAVLHIELNEIQIEGHEEQDERNSSSPVRLQML